MKANSDEVEITFIFCQIRIESARKVPKKKHGNEQRKQLKH